MAITFTVPCKNCGNPIVISVEPNTAGGKYGVCCRCAHGVSVNYHCDGDGKLLIHNIIY